MVKSFVSKGVLEPIPSDGSDCVRENAVLKNILASTSNNIVFQDIGGRIRFVTPSASDHYGIAPEDMSDRTWKDLGLRPGILTLVEQLREDAIAEKKKVRAVFQSSRDGRELEYSVFPVLGTNGAIEGTITIAADITERKRMEELRGSEEIIRMIMNNTEDPMFIKDRQGRYLMANKATLRTFDRTLKEVLGKTDVEINGDRATGRELMEIDRRIMDSGVGKALEETVPTADGDRFFMATKAPFHDEQGNVMGIVGIARDITKRKRAEDALLESEERFRSLIEDAPVAIGMSRDGRYTYVNPFYLKMFGFNDLNELLGRPFVEEIAPEDRKKAMNVARRTEGRSSEIQLVGRRKDGSLFPFHAALTEIDLADGPVLLGFFTDITERKRTEDALLESEERYRMISDAAFEGIVIHVNGTIMDVNKASLDFIGYERDELIGQNIYDFLTPLSQLTVSKMASSLSTEPYEAGILQKNGGIIIARLRVRNMTYKGRPARVATLQDITELKQNQYRIESLARRAEEERQRLRAILDTLPIGLWISNRNGSIVEANSTVEQIWGRKLPKNKDFQIYRSLKLWSADPKDPAGQEVEGALYKAVVRGETTIGAMVDLQRADGTLCTVLSSAAPISDRDGKIVGAVGVIEDVTQQRQLEREAVEAKERAEMYIELLTHDITNYNTGAMGYLQLAEARLNLSEKDLQYITRPLQVLRESSELIANIRDLQRVEAGRERVELIDLCDMLREIKDVHENLAGRDIEITMMGDHDCHVIASPLLRDAFSNIVNNAIKHSTGHLHIMINVTNETRDGTEYVRTSIEDDGPGIPDERKEKIFDRSMSGLTRSVTRTLGLYLVKHLVEDYDGEVWVEDRVFGDSSKGARFVVLLPRAVSSSSERSPRCPDPYA